MNDSPETLLKSALEKIVYFEARSTQLENDLKQAKDDSERLKNELASGSQREIELRRVVAELEVRMTRAHTEREDAARVADVLRRERAELIGKMLEASRIHHVDAETHDFDLARFIAELRSEVMFHRDGAAVHVAAPVVPLEATVAEAPPAPPSAVKQVAEELKAQGRLEVNARDMSTLERAQPFPGRSEETLFGFSVRELSSPDSSARIRAAERLKALAHRAAAPALAAALHAEQEPTVIVALMNALSSVASVEGIPVVQPHLTSRWPDVRIGALKALLTLDASAAGPHLAAAMKDPDKAVRRRASLLALGLKGDEALNLGTEAIHDADADVRSLAALVLGASGSLAARPLLIEAMRDTDVRVVRSASQALSRLLGRDVSSLVSLDETQRRREVRRLASIAPQPVEISAEALAERHERIAPPVAKKSVVMSAVEHAAPMQVAAPVTAPAPRSQKENVVAQVPVAAPVVRAVPPAQPVAAAHQVQRQRVAVLEVEAPAIAASQVSDGILRELRSSIRGRPLEELASGLGVSRDDAMRACTALLNQGAVVRRGHKYFVA